MPARKMKSKSNNDCLSGDKLHACCKSTKILKGSHFEAKASQIIDNTSTHISLDASPVTEVSGQGIDTAEIIAQEDLFLRESTPLLKLPPLLPDLTSVDRKGSLSSGCHSIIETIFSPSLDHGKVKCVLMDHNIEDNEQPDLPHLVPDDSDDGSYTSRDYQSCNLTDYCISDSSDPLSFNGSTGFSDLVTDSSDCDLVDFDMTFDIPERYMILPFIDRTRQATSVQGVDLVEEAVVNSDDSCLYLAIHQLKSSDEDISSHSWDIEDLGSFDPQLFVKNLPDLPEAVSSLWPMLLPKETRKIKAITLVLDLDETLVHSTLEHCTDADFTFPVFFNMKEHTVYVKQRPYLLVFLEKVAQMFDIVIFTASQSIYAERLLDILDPGKKLISRRIYRESCIFSEGSYMKDLTVLGVDLAKVVIIDNSPQVFQLQVNNGIPIKSWFDDPSDCALITLLPFLETLVDVEDVRPIIARRFNRE